ncbi:MAG TPA: ribosome maturation factor RimP [Kineosporiaceae bacterium]|nr:ribosome maturation factor RimP [Kineosporiaceae bacterium]
MATTSQVERLRELAVPAVGSAGLVLEELTVTPVGRRRLLRVTVDLPEDVRGGVPVDAVAVASQALSQALDASDVMGEVPYVLEVSSPGVDRPLTQARHWKRARGRLVVVRLTSGGQLTGRLSEVTDTGIVVDGTALSWGEVAGGRVEVEFGRPEEPDPDGEGEALDDEDDLDDEDEDDMHDEQDDERDDAEGSA